MQAQIDFDQTFAKQEGENVRKFCRMMRDRHDILRKYENDWATMALLQRFIKSQRQMKKRKLTKEANLLASETATATATGTDKEDAVNAEDSSMSDDGSEKSDRERTAFESATEYDTWLGFSEGCAMEM
ncbi:hypothetical protein FA95DRAFT_1561218 [Auriscalpium vulgare]|uniref:Uncharacterized protein n=1 Tax=Auriscalpium vulgare TaxID=40419 RepID=A0ACB8RNG6_9AGAM|nr:hypothetical protein FA95DRAFT_1561218 [Auriscalpium vulgare]